MTNSLVKSLETASDFVVGNYHVSNTPMTWEDGNDYCNSQYGTSLATITNDDDAQTLLDLFEQNGDYWIGLYDYTEDNTGWAWVSGYPWFVTVYPVDRLSKLTLFTTKSFVCGDTVSDEDDCNTLTYWQSGQPDRSGQCGGVGWEVTAVTSLLDDDECSNGKNIVCDVGMLMCAQMMRL